jgi:hypothetical protein
VVLLARASIAEQPRMSCDLRLTGEMVINDELADCATRARVVRPRTDIHRRDICCRNHAVPTSPVCEPSTCIVAPVPR